MNELTTQKMDTFQYAAKDEFVVSLYIPGWRIEPHLLRFFCALLRGILPEISIQIGIIKECHYEALVVLEGRTNPFVSVDNQNLVNKYSEGAVV